MSRNLCTSECCTNVVRLSDVRGKPLEIRRYGPYAPVFGVRWDCPTCQTAYFVSVRTYDTYWGRDALRGESFLSDREDRGRFLLYNPREETGYFELDLSYYETYDDEPLETTRLLVQQGNDPLWLCKDNALDAQRLLNSGVELTWYAMVVLVPSGASGRRELRRFTWKCGKLPLPTLSSRYYRRGDGIDVREIGGFVSSSTHSSVRNAETWCAQWETHPDSPDGFDPVAE